MIASSPTSQNWGKKREKKNIHKNLVIFQKNRKIPLVCRQLWQSMVFSFHKKGKL
jgi:hypothetical protein